MMDNSKIIKQFFDNGIELLKGEGKDLLPISFFEDFENRKEKYVDELVEIMKKTEREGSNLLLSEMGLFNNLFKDKKLDVKDLLDIFKVILKSIKNIFRDNLIIRIITELLSEICDITKIIKRSSA